LSPAHPLANCWCRVRNINFDDRLTGIVGKNDMPLASLGARLIAPRASAIGKRAAGCLMLSSLWSWRRNGIRPNLGRMVRRLGEKCEMVHTGEEMLIFQ
jgi:hypothetical protein